MFIFRRIALAAFFLCLTGFVWPESAPSFDNALFEKYLDRASAAQDRDKWLRIARAGLDTVLAEWEAAAILVFRDADALAEKKADTLVALEERLSEWMAKWMVRKFSERTFGDGLLEYWTSVNGAASKLAYETDAGGDFLRDGNGYKARVSDRAAIDADKAVFRRDWEGQAATYLNAWHGGVETAYSELLAQAGDEEKLFLEQYRAGTLDALKKARARELAKMTHLAESAMVHSRLQNIEKPDPNLGLETASEARQRVSGIQNKIAGGLERLKNDLETDAQDPNVADGKIDAERWRESFKEELEKGMALWDDAQNAMVKNRAAWEARAGNDLEQGVKDWEQAFKDLEAARVQWLADFDSIKTRGETLWEDEKRELSNALDAAKAEMAENALSREGSMLERVNALVDMLGQSLNMMSTARENFAYWLNKVNPKSTLELEDVPNDLNGMRKLYDKEITEYTHRRDTYNNNILVRWGIIDPMASTDKDAEQARYWLEKIYTTYKNYAEDAYKELYNTYNITLFGESGLDENGIKGTNAVNIEDGRWQEFFLDEYQVELLKAQAVANFWKKERDVAQAAADYAEENANLPREEQADKRRESEMAYDSALTDYNEALADYEEAVKALNAANKALTDNSGKIAEVQEKLSTLKKELETAQQAYQNQILLIELDSVDYFQEQLRDYYAQLLGLDGSYQPQAAERAADNLNAYLEAVKNEAGKGFLKSSADIARNLVLGDPENGVLSLKALLTRYNTALNWHFDQTDLGAGGFRADFLSDLKDAWNLSVKDSAYKTIESFVNQAGTSIDPETQARLRLEIHSITAGLLRRYRGELELMLNQLKLLSDENPLTWAGISDASSYSSDDIAAKLEEHNQQARAKFIANRISRDKQTLTEVRDALTQWLNSGKEMKDFSLPKPDDFSDEKAVLGWLYAKTYNTGTFAAKLDADIKTLEELENAIAGKTDFDSLAEALRPLIQNNALASSYVNNGSVFSFNGRDYGSMFLADEWSTFDQAVKAGQVWDTFGSLSIAGRDMFRQEAIAGLRGMLRDAGLAEESSGSWQFRNAMTLWDELGFVREDEVLDWLANLRDKLSGFQSTGPEALREELYRWQRQLENYFLVKSRALSGGLTKADIESGFVKLEEGQDALKADYEWLEAMNSVSEPLTKLAYALLIDESDTKSETILISTLAGELAASMAPDANLGEDEPWNDAMTHILDVLELDDEDNEAGLKLKNYFDRAKVLARERIEGARGIAGNDAAYEKETLFARMNSLSFEDLTAVLTGAWTAPGSSASLSPEDTLKQNLQGYKTDERAVLHYLKKAAYERKTADAVLAGFALSAAAQTKLDSFIAMLNAMRQYISAKDGDFFHYLIDAGIDENIARGAAASIWEDGFFINPIRGVLSSDSEKRSWTAEFLRGKQKYFHSVAGSYAEKLGQSIQEALNARGDALRATEQRLSYAKRKAALAPGAWRLYLDKEFLRLKDGEEWSDASSAGTKIVPAAKLADVETKDEADVLYRAFNKQMADVLETWNLLNGANTALAGVLETWEQEQFSSEALQSYHNWAAAFSGDANALSTQDALKALEDLAPLTMNPALTEALNKKKTIRLQEEEGAAGIKAKIATFGKSVADYLASSGNAANSKALQDARKAVTAVKEDIEQVQKEWAELIGRKVNSAPAAGKSEYTYREAEYLYAKAYETALEKIRDLENAKLNYRSAKAIRDYAVSYHLYLGRDIAGDYHDLDDEMQVELKEFQAQIDAIRPEKILAEAEDEYRRAQNVVEVLKNAYSRNPKTLAETDWKYRSLTEKVKTAKKNEIALTRLEGMLAEYREKTLGEYDKAKEKREAALRKLSNTTHVSSDKGLKGTVGITQNNFPTRQRYLQTLDIKWDSNGRAIITFDNNKDSMRNDADRSTRLAQFFGTDGKKPPNEKYETYEDLLHNLLLTMRPLDKNQIDQWFEAVLYEMMAYSMSEGSRPAYAAFMDISYGNYPHKHNWNHIIHLIFEAEAPRGYNDLGRSSASIVKDNTYQFFKLACIADLVGENGFSFKEMGNNKAQNKAHTVTVHGINAWNWFWHRKAANRVANARDNYGSEYADQRDLFMGALTEYKDLYAIEAQYESNIKTAKGSDNPDFNELLRALDLTLRQSPGYQAKEIANLLNINYTPSNWIGLLNTRFNTLKNAISAKELSQVRTLPQLLERLLQKATDQRTAAEEELDRYLYREDPDQFGKKGIARQQEEKREEFIKAQDEFLTHGILPASGYNMNAGESVLADWQTTGDEKTRNTLAAHIRGHLSTLERRGEMNFLLQKNLLEIMDTYANSPDDAVFAQGADMFGMLLEAYRAGERYANAAANAWNSPLYNARDVLGDKWKQDSSLFETLKSGSAQMVELGSSQQLPKMMEELKAYLNARMTAYQSVRDKEMDLLIAEGDRRHKTWQNQMTAMLARGNIEWKLAEIKMNKEHVQWQKDFQKTLQDGVKAWDLQYENFLTKKNQWVSDITEQAVHVGDEDILTRVGMSAKEAIAETSRFIMPDLPALPDLDNFMGRILNRTMLSTLLENAKGLEDGIGAIETKILTSLGRNPYVTGEMLNKIREFQTAENEELAARMALVQYERMLDTLDEAVAGLDKSVADANADYAESIRQTLADKQFRRSGNNFIKNTLVMSTLWGNTYEDHVIEGYKYYDAHLPDLKMEAVPVSDALIEELGSMGIQALLDRAMKALEDEQIRVFGNGERVYVSQKTGKEGEYLNKDAYDKLRASREALSESERVDFRYNEINSGELSAHIGYEPVFINNPDPEISLSQWRKNVRFPGSGEQGRIYGMLMQHQKIEAYAESEMRKPFYEKKLWDDRGMEFKAITLRTVGDIAAAVVASVATIGMGSGVSVGLIALSVGINLSDDLLFTTLDMATGYRTVEQSLESFGKKALSAIASSAIGAIGAGVFDKARVIAKTALVGVRALGSQVATSTINAVRFDGNGISFDGEAFVKGINLGNIAASMAGSFVQFGLDKVNLTGFVGDVLDNGKLLNNLIGTTVTAGFEYALTGSTTLNILSFSDFFMGSKQKPGLLGDFSKTNVGLLELRLSKDGSSLGIGRGGHNFGIGTIASAMKGIEAYQVNNEIRKAELDEDITEGMRTLYSAMGLDKEDTTLRDTYDDIISGKVKVRIGTGQDYDGHTVLSNGVRYMDLNASGKSNLDMAVLLAHEAYRDGIEVQDLGQAMETARASFGHMNVATQLAAAYGLKSLNERNALEAFAYAKAIETEDWSMV
ncbi:MAG: hypothetical protein B0D92_05860, partial [Spirochaeta sp. LUC14_002_19_P3]